MHLFFSKNVSGSHITLPEDESLHAIKVLRLTEGTIVGCMDGSGNHYLCTISKAHAKKTELNITTHTQHERSRTKYVHIAIAPTKNSDRIEWFVEKAIEIGVDKISFLLCEHSERKAMNMDRTERVAMAALKQSQQYYIPEMEDMVKFSTFVEKCKNLNNKYIAHLEDSDRQGLVDVIKDKQEVLILIGPEGDFSKAEIDLALKNGFKAVTLGNNRLRTETAGVYAVTVCNVNS